MHTRSCTARERCRAPGSTGTQVYDHTGKQAPRTSSTHLLALEWNKGVCAEGNEGMHLQGVERNDRFAMPIVTIGVQASSQDTS
eukprot:5103346-Pleurochrysis_carterae.AAC.8